MARGPTSGVDMRHDHVARIVLGRRTAVVPLLAFEVVAASTATVHEKCDQDTIYTYISHYEPPQTSGIFNPVLITGIRKFQRQRLTTAVIYSGLLLSPLTGRGRPRVLGALCLW